MAVRTRIVNGKTSTTSIAIFTSYASIFLPRYSGVRPTINPGDKDREHDKDQHSVKSRTHTSENNFAELNVKHRHESTERGKRVVHRIDRTARCVRCDSGKECGIENPEANFL